MRFDHSKPRIIFDLSTLISYRISSDSKSDDIELFFTDLRRSLDEALNQQQLYQQLIVQIYHDVSDHNEVFVGDVYIPCLDQIMEMLVDQLRLSPNCLIDKLKKTTSRSLIISHQESLLRDAKDLGYETITCAAKGELDATILIQYIDRPLAVYIDIDNTLLRRSLSIISNKTILNASVVELLQSLTKRDKPVNFYIITSRTKDIDYELSDDILSVASVMHCLFKTTGILIENDRWIFTGLGNDLASLPKFNFICTHLFHKPETMLVLLDDNDNQIILANQEAAHQPNRISSVIIHVWQDMMMTDDGLALFKSFCKNKSSALEQGIFSDSRLVEKLAAIALTKQEIDDEQRLITHGR